MAFLKVITSGFLVTIQDQGRRSCQQFGLAEAGAMDKHAYFWSNHLLNNVPGSASLEILVGNCSFSFDAPTIIALTGCEMGATLNGTPLTNWSTTTVQTGDILHFNLIQNGLRAYLSIAGGFKTPRFFNSSSTMIREQTGGTHGGKLEKGDIIRYDAHVPNTVKYIQQRIPKRYIPDYNKELTLHFFPGYHFEEFDRQSVEVYLKSLYTVTNDADRMGYRLSGPPLKRDKGDILSIGVPCGAIQIPTAGEPIILLNDRQCTGGYPILGVVALKDIYRLSQRKPGDKIRFSIADTKEHRKESLDFYRFFYRVGDR